MRVLDTIDRQEIARLRAGAEFFWLDLVEPETATLAVLGELFDLHPIALEDLEHFGQRPKIDDYDRFIHIVFYGIHGEQPVEVHIVVHGDAMITVRRADGDLLAAARQRIAETSPEREEYAVHRVLDALTDSFFPYLELLDDEVDALEGRVIEGSDSECLQRIVALKRSLTMLRRLIAPQRDVLANAAGVFVRLPGFTGDGSHDYFRDVYDHLLRIHDAIESFRDVLTGLLDVQLSAQSNRLNAYITRLTVLGTVFLPLTFITGFFGQNFRWLVEAVDTRGDFLVLGIGLEVLSVLVLLAWFRRAGVKA